ncbi:MAG: ATP-dependent Clp protease adaptor ClpS [Planctomycetes bacterium]|nr:ATP-dependent Clp protease adaptor ClpS [Planctomycetota bacterium]
MRHDLHNESLAIYNDAEHEVNQEVKKMPDQEPPKLTESATDLGATGAAVQTPAKPTPAKPKHHKLPPYKLLLHNDEFNTMDDVVIRIVKLTPLSAAQAIRKMLEAHRSGKAILLVTHKERGELYVQQFASARISTSLEPDV